MRRAYRIAVTVLSSARLFTPGREYPPPHLATRRTTWLGARIATLLLVIRRDGSVLEDLRLVLRDVFM
jgi:hypothetical protein